jgi:hypothetical protein
MQEAEGMNFSVGVPNEGPSGPQKIKPTRGIRHNNPTLNDVLSFINGLPLNKTDKERLVSVARKTPNGALLNLKKNYMRHVGKERPN